jgi:hypothetical protein
MGHKAYIGCDPGEKGSWCLLMPDTNYFEFFPTASKPIDTIEWLIEIKRHSNIQIILIEEVHSIYGVSAGSNFKFGYNVGLVNGIAGCTGTMLHRVPPKKWQKFIGVKSKGKLIKKEVAGICEELYPKVNIRGPKGGLLDGLSDSLMIAHYASLNY